MIEEVRYSGPVSNNSARKEKTVAKTTEVPTDVADNVETSEEPRSDDLKCDNHPYRKARNFTGGNVYSVNLCDVCTPPWFKDAEASL